MEDPLSPGEIARQDMARAGFYIDNGFPTHVYSPRIQEFIDQVSTDVGEGIRDYIAAGVLPVAATALGRKHRVMIGGDWDERGGAIWVALVGKPGVKKSPALRSLISPLKIIDRRLAQGNRNELKTWQEDDPKTRGERPPWHQIRVGDVTMEKLAAVLEQNPNGVIMVADELRGWLKRFNAYRSGDDRQKVLSFWSGSSEIIQRQSRDLPVVLEEPTLSVLGGIQPSVIADLWAEDDGFAPRMLFAMGEYVDGEYHLPSARHAVYDYWDDLVERMWRMGGYEAYMDPDAYELADHLYGELCRKAGTDDNGIGEVHAKMQAYLFRFAGVLNGLDAVESGRGQVTLSQIERANAIVEYFTGTSKVVRQLDDGSNAHDLEWARKLSKLSAWLDEHPGATRKTVLQKGPAWARKAEVLALALRDLGRTLKSGSRNDGQG